MAEKLKHQVKMADIYDKLVWLSPEQAPLYQLIKNSMIYGQAAIKVEYKWVEEDLKPWVTNG